MNIGTESEAFVAEPLELPDTAVEQPEREAENERERVLVPVARDAEEAVTA